MMTRLSLSAVIPAKAGIQTHLGLGSDIVWTPAFAGVTEVVCD